jgi:hypothetical protein
MSTNRAELTTDKRWQQWIREHPVLGPALAGLIATQLATIVGYYLRGIGLPQVPWPLFNGALFAPAGEFGSPASFFVGQSIHMVDGVLFAILFVVLVRSRIPLPNTNMGNVGKGLVYSMVMALVSAGFLVPYCYAPKSGYGFFSFESPDTWKLPLSILIFHAVYGYFLGLLANPGSGDDYPAATH